MEYSNRRNDPIPPIDGTLLEPFIAGEFKLSMWIPDELAGRVVGRKGTVITNMIRETQAKLINALPAVNGSLWIAIVIIGTWKSVFAAYHTISKIVNGEVDDVVLEFIINYRKPFFIYGPKKEGFLKFLSARANVRVVMPEFNYKDLSYGPPPPPMTLEGSFECVQNAIALLEEESISYRKDQEERAKERKILTKDKDKEKDNRTKDKEREKDQERDKPKEKEKEKELTAGKISSATIVTSITKDDKKKPVIAIISSVTTTTTTTTGRVEKEKPAVTKPGATSATSASLPPPIPPSITTVITSTGQSKAMMASSQSQPATNKPTTTKQEKQVEKPVPAKLHDAKEKEKEKEKVILTSVPTTKTITISANLMSLLQMSKVHKGNKTPTIMRKIESMTKTKITGVEVALPPPEESVSAASAVTTETSHRRRRTHHSDDSSAASDDDDDDDDHEENDSDSESSSHDSDSSNDSGASAADSKKEEGSKGSKAIAIKKKVYNANKNPVVLSVVGDNVESVDLVIDFVTKLIKGDRLKTLLENLKVRVALLFGGEKSAGQHPTTATAAATAVAPIAGVGQGDSNKKGSKQRGPQGFKSVEASSTTAAAAAAAAAASSVAAKVEGDAHVKGVASTVVSKSNVRARKDDIVEKKGFKGERERGGGGGAGHNRRVPMSGPPAINPGNIEKLDANNEKESENKSKGKDSERDQSKRKDKNRANEGGGGGAGAAGVAGGQHKAQPKRTPADSFERWPRGEKQKDTAPAAAAVTSAAAQDNKEATAKDDVAEKTISKQERGRNHPRGITYTHHGKNNHHGRASSELKGESGTASSKPSGQPPSSESTA